MAKIIYISDFSLSVNNGIAHARSGYSGIGMELCDGLQKIGHDVKAIGIGYGGQEHTKSFSLIPCNSTQDAVGIANNLKYLWNPDVVIVAMDIHYWQETLFPLFKKLGLKYICITPLESEPLCITWANLLLEMDGVFFISDFGANEARKAGVEKAQHIRIGADTETWKLRTEEEYQNARKTLGYSEDDFVIITVADNQERKNLSAGFEIVKKIKDNGVKARHILVTREKSIVGWKLYDLAYEIGISSDVRVFDSTLPAESLYLLYCAADAYLSCSKGEGLGLPILESMAVGVPVVASRVGAIPELLADGRGIPVESEYMTIDPFGNQNRYFIDKDKAVQALLQIRNGNWTEMASKARRYVESLSWRDSVTQIHEMIEAIHENKDIPV